VTPRARRQQEKETSEAVTVMVGKVSARERNERYSQWRCGQEVDR
jgi:hypothetical protein